MGNGMVVIVAYIVNQARVVNVTNMVNRADIMGTFGRFFDM